MATETRKQTFYKEQVVPALMKQFGYTSIMQVPRIEKIILSRGVGDAVNDKKQIDYAAEELGLITGQKPVVTSRRRLSRT